MVKFWTRRKSPYLSRKNETNVQQRRLGAFLCGVPERVGAARDDDAGGSVAGRAAGVRAHAGNLPGGEGSNHCRTGNIVDKEGPRHLGEEQGAGEGQHRELR